MTSPSIRAVATITSTPAVIEPLILPATRAFSATTMPVTTLVSPCTSEAQLISPSILPSKCRSTFAIRLPLMAISGPRTEKVDPVIAPLPEGRSVDSGLFENIGGHLQEWAGIDGLAVEPNLEMQMRTGGTAGAANGPYHLTGPDRFTHARSERGHVRIAGQQTIAVIDLDAISIAGTLASEGDRAPRGGIDGSAERRFEIQPGMECGAPFEGIAPVTEVRGNILSRRGDHSRYPLEPPL